MSQIIETPSGIALAVTERSEREIDRDLKRLDRDLFLTKEVHRPTGGRFYTVYHYQGHGLEPIHVLYWTSDRTRTGTPLPLSSGLVYEVEARKRFWGRDLVAEAEAENTERQERDLALADEEREETSEYFRRRLRLGSAANSRRYFRVGKTGRG